MINKIIHRTALLITLLITASATQAEIVVVVGPSTPPPTKAQVEELYLGKNFDYKPLDFKEGAPVREQFYKKLTNREITQIKALWARLIFTGKGQMPLQLPDANSVKKAVASDPKAIGFIEKSEVDSTVKVILTLD